MGKLLEGAIHISDWEAVPWHDYNIHMHCRYSPRLKETTLTLYSKDHKKVVNISDEEHSKVEPTVVRDNWCLEQKRVWQRELRAMYQNMGD